jgi:hypothetical protein
MVKYVCLFVVVDISGPIVNNWTEMCFAAVVFTKCVLFVRNDTVLLKIAHDIW